MRVKQSLTEVYEFAFVKKASETDLAEAYGVFWHAVAWWCAAAIFTILLVFFVALVWPRGTPPTSFLDLFHDLMAMLYLVPVVICSKGLYNEFF